MRVRTGKVLNGILWVQHIRTGESKVTPSCRKITIMLRLINQTRECYECGILMFVAGQLRRFLHISHRDHAPPPSVTGSDSYTGYQILIAGFLFGYDVGRILHQVRARRKAT